MTSRIRTFISELQRRRVIRASAGYAAAALVAVEAANNFFPPLHLPDWTVTLVAALAVLGFPVAVALAWAFDLTPGGVKRTEDGEVAGADLVAPRRTASHRWTMAAVAGTAIVLAAAIVWRGTLGARVAEGAVAVLPFTSLGDDPEDEFFTDGITDDVLTHLYKIGELKVISHTSVEQYKGTRKSIRTIGRELGASALLEGSVRRVNQRIHINAQLIDARTDEHLWAETYDRDLKDILAVQTEIAERIATAMHARLSPAERQRFASARRTVDPKVYEQYLRGLYYMGDGRHMPAMQEFQRVIAQDPTFAPAYAAQAENSFRMAFMGMIAPGMAFESLRANASKALQLDPTIGEAHAALGLYYMHYRWNWSEAERQFKEAIRLSPSSASVRHDYAHLLMAMARYDESASETRRSSEADPFNSMLIACAGWHRLPEGQTQTAVEAAQRALQLNPSLLWANLILGWAYEEQRDYPRAIAAFSDGVAHGMGSGVATAALAQAYAASGDVPNARRLLARLQEMSRTSYVSPYDIAAVYASLGETRPALDWLRRARDEHSLFFVHLPWDPRFDSLRDDAGFRELLKELGLPRPPGRAPTA